ncbi:hypothetical protein ACJMK2_007951 [Sinanodonta woodiana]|uniref:Trifunctional purine biosynthetic protein adenosine-3 n=1 Tax=Sinanodonta woodiana TaxID=1069815 RepID=A0ABD3VKA5_SINWO
MAENVLVLGGGGREHALSWKLAQSPLVKTVFVAPGNAGTANEEKVENVTLNLKDFNDITDFCSDHNISLVVVGPEDPLAQGITDHLLQKGIPCFGPSAKASQIEASKYFAKHFMTRHKIPTARFESFTDFEAACQHIRSAGYPSLVVKASGLAAGKGVTVASSVEEACEAARKMLKEEQFGQAGMTIVVEELLEGEEVSVLAFSDGSTVALMPPAQDHKRLLDGDKGPNTGGMGALCPYPKLGLKDLEDIKVNIIQKTIDGLREEGIPFKGVLYAGLMMTRDGPKVLEYNCRFGDPETESILPLLQSDLYSVCRACVDGTLAANQPRFDLNKKVVGVVVVSGGYPDSYKKGCRITGLDKVAEQGLKVFHAGTAIKDGEMVTNGGRVLVVTAVSDDFHCATNLVQKGAALVKFDGAFHRKDIGFRVVNRFLHSPPTITYKDSGVDIDAGDSLVEAIKPLAENTARSGCVTSIGSFGALFDLKAAGYKDPILVSGTDGVGTKLKIALAVGQHGTIGIDLVAMSVNDILAHGAEPLFFLDYFATGRLDVGVARDVIAGITEGCKIAGCALIGGETAEMPGLYRTGDYDIAGFAVGAVERDNVLPRIQSIEPGDGVIGLSSSGIHSNGFSLVRKLVKKLELGYDMPSPFKTGKTLGEDLLTPTKIYVKSLLPLMRSGDIKAFAHITGGGLVDNLPRVLPEEVFVKLDAKKWKVPSVFGWLADKGNIKESEMARTFNCGIGGVLIVDIAKATKVIEQLQCVGEEANLIGQVEKLTGFGQRVVIQNLQSALVQSWRQVPGVSRKKRVGVLISGSGTNLQALIDYTREPHNHSAAELVLVISNKPGVQGLQRAEKVGIMTKVINHKDYKNREEFDDALHHSLMAAGVEIVCLAGFMRILTGGFVRKWSGHMLNVHPSLLPSFKGSDAVEQALGAHVRITGCTVHFVAEEVDAGAILVQESVPVYPNDTTETLHERIRHVEHLAFPRALELVASEKAVLGENGQVIWRT